MKAELLSLNKEVALMESLRNQLISTQNMVKDRDAMIGDLSQQIENLKTTPTTVKKTKKASVESVSTLEMATEDGGSF